MLRPLELVKACSDCVLRMCWIYFQIIAIKEEHKIYESLPSCVLERPHIGAISDFVRLCIRLMAERRFKELFAERILCTFTRGTSDGLTPDRLRAIASARRFAMKLLFRSKN